MKGQVCVWGVIASHLLVLHLLSVNILCLKGLYQLSAHPAHAEGSLAFSLHVLNPDLLTLTLTQDASESAYASDSAIWSGQPTLRQAGVRQTEPVVWWRGGGLIFKLDFFSIVLLFSLVSDRSAAATAVVMDGWTGDVMWNVPWSQVKVEREPNPRPVSVWGRWVYQAERNVYFYGLNVSVEFVMEVNSVV